MTALCFDRGYGSAAPFVRVLRWVRGTMGRSAPHTLGRPAMETTMIRTALTASVLGCLMLAASGALAQGLPSDNDDSRYTFNRTDEGYLRLDGRTGQVSICFRRPVGWACQMVPDERAAIEVEIGRLQGENALLKKELLSRNLPLPGQVKPDLPPVAKNEEPRLQLPSDADINKVVTFIEKVWRRLVEVIVTIQKDMMKGS